PAESVVALRRWLADDGCWAIGITDSGAGMPEVELQRVNRRLVEPPEVDVEVSRRMGLYVVSRLSARHGFEVALQPAATGGIAANVVVPARLVTVICPESPGRVTEQEATLRLTPQLPTQQWPTSDPESDTAAAVVDWPQVDPVDTDEVMTEITNPGWPTSDPDVNPAEPGGLTQRLPACRDVLADWFRVGDDGNLGDLRMLRDSTAATTQWASDWPASADAVWIEPGRTVTEDGTHAVALPKRIPWSDRVPAAADTPAMDETGHGLGFAETEADTQVLDEHMGLTM